MRVLREHSALSVFRLSRNMLPPNLHSARTSVSFPPGRRVENIFPHCSVRLCICVLTPGSVNQFADESRRLHAVGILAARDLFKRTSQTCCARMHSNVAHSNMNTAATHTKQACLPHNFGSTNVCYIVYVLYMWLMRPYRWFVGREKNISPQKYEISRVDPGREHFRRQCSAKLHTLTPTHRQRPFRKLPHWRLCTRSNASCEKLTAHFEPDALRKCMPFARHSLLDTMRYTKYVTSTYV